MKVDENVGLKGISQRDFLFIKSPSYKLWEKKILYLSFILCVQNHANRQTGNA